MGEFHIKEIMRQEISNQFTESLWMLYIRMKNNRSRNLKLEYHLLNSSPPSAPPLSTPLSTSPIPFSSSEPPSLAPPLQPEGIDGTLRIL